MVKTAKFLLAKARFLKKVCYFPQRWTTVAGLTVLNYGWGYLLSNDPPFTEADNALHYPREIAHALDIFDWTEVTAIPPDHSEAYLRALVIVGLPWRSLQERRYDNVCCIFEAEWKQQVQYNLHSGDVTRTKQKVMHTSCLRTHAASAGVSKNLLINV